jgi:hypothetical protein
MERPIRLDDATWSVLERIAREDDVSVGQVVREAIARDIRRRAEAKTPVRADERLVAPLRALLADDFAYAQGWADLQARLLAKGYRLAEAGGGLILQSQATSDRICKASELGYSYSALLRRFDCVFPGHSHTAPLRRIRGN